MPESVAAVGSYFTADAAAATAATASEAAIPAATSAAAAGTAASAAGSLLSSFGSAAATAAGTAVATSLLAPKRPDLPKPLAMPDPLAQEQERKKSLIEQMARRGRASSILSDAGGDNSSGKLGG